MNRKQLGKTGIEVSEIAMGGAFVTSRQGPFEQARGAVQRAVELGMNYVDTAPSYGDSEEVLGRILPGIDTPLVLSTKLGGRPEPFDPQDRDCLMRSVENSLRVFKRDNIDILFVHEPERPRQYDWWTDPERFDGPVLELLADLKADGPIRATGVGGTTAYEMAHIIRTGKFDVVLTAFNYSLLWREAEREVLPAAVSQGMGIVLGSPLQQGALARRYDDEVENGARWLSSPRREQYKALYAFLDEIGMSITEAAHRFVMSNPDITCMLTGARSAEEVEGNVAEVEKGPLPEEVLTRLDEIAAMVPFRPFDEPFGLPFGREYKGPGKAGG
ncbi:MAG: aldo/keto reductase [Candidatus Latescibacteria bacterium]|jgi:aryl-alcohol dehydrogenase-like predicted oxidoreductase|nr:aldo/keto reductase [Candidatus Latescibacterota bacterium]